MNFKKYEHFGTEDFVEDEYFCQWVSHREEALDLFWRQIKQLYPHKNEEIVQAKQIVQSLQGHFKSKEKEVSTQATKASFREITKKIEDDNRIVPFRQKVLWWSVAASILLALSVGSFYFFKPSQKVLTYSTGNGQRININLPDSSQIQLNANSILSYVPEKWEEKTLREVNLEGEAFFKVAKTKEKIKFIVHSGAVDVAVLGTEFNVRSRGEDSEVVLAEGAIELNIANQKLL